MERKVMEKSQNHFIKHFTLQPSQAMFKSTRWTQYNPEPIYNWTLNHITNGINKDQVSLLANLPSSTLLQKSATTVDLRI